MRSVMMNMVFDGKFAEAGFFSFTRNVDCDKMYTAEFVEKILQEEMTCH